MLLYLVSLPSERLEKLNKRQVCPASEQQSIKLYCQINI